MKVKELMIGDWVKVTDDDTDDSFIGQVKAIDELENINVPEGEDVAYPYSIDCLEPIPLTPEILEKNGFKIDKNETYWKRYFFACNLGKVPQTVVEFYFYGEEVSADTLFNCWTKPESCDGENSIHICDLKTVHELQHALRLCGIEKEITL